MSLTPSMARSLQIIADHPGIRPEPFARTYFGPDHPGWRRHARCGNGTRKGGGLVLWAGGQIGKLRSAGLVTDHNHLTRLGRDTLQSRPLASFKPLHSQGKIDDSLPTEP